MNSVIEKSEVIKHYYECYGKRYDNMKDARDTLGLNARAFRNKVKNGTFKKIIVNNSQQGQYNENNKTKG